MDDHGTVAVIGSGVAGLTAAYLLRKRYRVVLFEADDRLGGHAHTHDLPVSRGGTVPVDSGFIVHNQQTYPNLIRLFGELGVATQPTEMSMSVRCDGCGLEYAGGRKLAGLLPTARVLARPAYLRMLREVPRFHRAARALLAAGSSDDELTLGQFLHQGGYSRYFVDHFALPVVSAVWSSPAATSGDYPARYLFSFLANHGMLSVTGAPPWLTVTGGSREYVQRAAKPLAEVRTATPVRAVHRHADGVTIRDDADQLTTVDRVVIATHPDQALGLLADPTPAERATLGAFTYSRNETWLHTDTSVLPGSSNAKASWNYRKPACASGNGAVLVSYDMNRLMRIPGPDRYLVTLNPRGQVQEESVLRRMTYEHPVYTPASLAAQRTLPELATASTVYAGAYHGWGFHEDGCASGVRAAAMFGVRW